MSDICAICSDTNIWLDFGAIDEVCLPLSLPHKIYISREASAEIFEQCSALSQMIQSGLIIQDASEIDILLQQKYSLRYCSKISAADAMAMALAKSHNWILLTGDRNLKIVAESEGIVCRGTIWVIDELRDMGIVTQTRVNIICRKLITAVKENGRRLPLSELKNRIV